MLEDTRVHAIDPSAAPFSESAHAVAAKPADASAHEPAVADSSDEPAKDQDRLAAPAEAADAPSSPVISGSAASLEQPSTPVPANTAIAMKVPEPEVAEPQAGPIFSVSATALAQPVPAAVSGVIAMTSPDGHPPLPLSKPSVIAAKLVAGATAAAVEAAEPQVHGALAHSRDPGHQARSPA